MKRNKAFTLVELSIVLVILGLLVGGVLAGQNLIRAAELRKVGVEWNQYQTAMHVFQDKYFTIPGDMDNATAFWGSMTNCGAASPSGSGTQTCNGNGNDIISVGGASQTSEAFGFFKHLSNAGLLDGSYTGITGPNSSGDAQIGVNVPTFSGDDSVGWSLHHWQPTGHSWIPEGISANKMYLGKDATNEWTYVSWLTPEEAWGIDKKIDDGMPMTGTMVASFATCTDAANSTDFSALYNLDSTSISCSLIFNLD